MARGGLANRLPQPALTKSKEITFKEGNGFIAVWSYSFCDCNGDTKKEQRDQNTCHSCVLKLLKAIMSDIPYSKDLNKFG